MCIRDRSFSSLMTVVGEARIFAPHEQTQLRYKAITKMSSGETIEGNLAMSFNLVSSFINIKKFTGEKILTNGSITLDYSHFLGHILDTQLVNSPDGFKLKYSIEKTPKVLSQLSSNTDQYMAMARFGDYTVTLSKFSLGIYTLGVEKTLNKVVEASLQEVSLVECSKVWVSDDYTKIFVLCRLLIAGSYIKVFSFDPETQKFVQRDSITLRLVIKRIVQIRSIKNFVAILWTAVPQGGSEEDIAISLYRHDDKFKYKTFNELQILLPSHVIQDYTMDLIPSQDSDTIHILSLIHI
eukprot:TRINITY_DN17984_c0_g2_i1.p1 TRINITY_DN17984_c0_g2~~TRINITY_DN17984_c0_g2_i1.p1  ORF type:complete len:296 (+),score=23.08 TRINITY_DN17984_c0_g2_i1:64-951(+)